MALKFLNKKGWHTGSLRNIENVWKAEQKHEAEQKKLEELRKQIHEERERAEFRQLQEQAGLISKQDRLDFLYDSGLAVGKGGSSFKALESLPKADAETNASSSTSNAKQQSATPGALFEDKPQSANDSWRKLHSDPLLLIRQKEQEALARVKNNPIQMAMIRKSVESKKGKGKDEKKHRKEHKRKRSKRKHSEDDSDSDSEDVTLKTGRHRDSHQKGSKSGKKSREADLSSEEESSEREERRKKYQDKDYKDRRHSSHPDHKYDNSDSEQKHTKVHYNSQSKEYSSKRERESHHDRYSNSNSSDKPPRPEPLEREREFRHDRNSHFDSSDKPPRPKPSEREIESHQDRHGHFDSSDKPPRPQSSERERESRHDRHSHFDSSEKPPRPESHRRRAGPVKLSEEERAARLKEMQMDAERHEEQRWKRIKTAAASDAEEAIRDNATSGRNFLDAAHKSVYGAEKGGSSTIEESVRRRTHYLQGRSASDANAFRR